MLEGMDTDSTTELNPACEEPKAEVKSETMKFIQTIRQTAEQLQESLDELSDVISFIPNIEDCYLDDWPTQWLYEMHKQQIQSYFNIELLCNRPVWADVLFDSQKLTFILKTWLVQLSYDN